MTEKIEGKSHLTARMAYVDPDEWAQWKKYCKNVLHKSVSKRVREIMANDLTGTSPTTDEFNLSEAEDREAKLASKNRAIEKELGGNKSTLYRALCRLAVNLGLKLDYSNLDEGLVALMNYQLKTTDSFSANDLSLFRKKLQIMAELRLLRAAILAERQRRLTNT
jgi:hypothetical protein